MFEVLLRIALILALVTLLGHGLWLLCAWILRALGRLSAPPPGTRGRRPSPSARAGGGEPAAGDGREELERSDRPDEWEVTRRRLLWLHETGRLDRETYRRVLDAALEAARAGAPLEPAAGPLPEGLRAPPGPVPVAEAAPGGAGGAAPALSLAPCGPAATTTGEPAPAAAGTAARFEEEAGGGIPAAGPAPPGEPAGAGAVLEAPVAERSLARILAAFMEERNIRWGEITGGMLILLSSAALVVSLWSRIEAVQWLQFAVFLTVTAGLFAAGLYSHHRWRLATTSKGVLAIAALLVPLDFLAVAAATRAAPPAHPLAVGGELLALGLFSYLLLRAGRVLAPPWPGLLALGVVVPAAIQLLLRRLAAREAWPLALPLLAGVSLAAYAAAVGAPLARARRWRFAGRLRVAAVFFLLGTATFAALAVLGLATYLAGLEEGESLRGAMRRLSAVAGLHGVPAVAWGAVLWRRVTSPRLVAQRTAATAVAILGGLWMLLGPVLAWPGASYLALAAAASGAALSALAFLLRSSLHHWFAAPCLALAATLFALLLTGTVSWSEADAGALVDALLSAPAGYFLSIVAALLGVASVLLGRARRREALAYGGTAAASAAASACLLTCLAFGRPEETALPWVYLLQGLAAWAGGWRLERRALFWLGSCLLFAAALQAIAYNLAPRGPLEAPFELAALVHATALAALALAARGERRELRQVVVPSLGGAALVAGAIALVLALAGLSLDGLGGTASRILWLAAVSLAVAAAWRRRALFLGFEALASLAILLAVEAALSRRVWFQEAAAPLLHPWNLQVLASLAVAAAALWIGLRLAASRFLKEPHPEGERPGLGLLRCFLERPALPVDTVLLSLSLAVLVSLGYQAWEPLLSSWSLWSPESGAGLPERTAQAQGWGSWVLCGLLAAGFLAGLREVREGSGTRGLFPLIFVGALACALGAAPFLASGRALAASRWFLAAYLLGLSALAPGAGRLGRRLGFPAVTDSRAGLPGALWLWILSLTLLPVAAVTALECRGILAGGGERGLFAGLSPGWDLALPLLFSALALLVHGVRERSPLWVLAASFAANLAITSGHLGAAAATGAIDGVYLLQANGAVSAWYALAWIAATARNGAAAGAPGASRELHAGLLGLAWVLLGAADVTAGWLLTALPEAPAASVVSAGGAAGWLALLGAAGAGLLRPAVAGRGPGAVIPVAAGLAAAFQAAFFACRWDTGEEWLGFHVLLVALVAASWAPVLAGAWGRRTLAREGGGSFLAAALAVLALAALLALRGGVSDPLGPWWGAGTLAACALAAAGLALAGRREDFLHPAGLFILLATGLGYTGSRWWDESPAELPRLLDLAALETVALVAGGLLAVAAGGLMARRPGPPGTPEAGPRALGVSAPWPPYQDVAAVLSLAGAAGVAGVSLAAAGWGTAEPVRPLLAWAAVASSLGFMVERLRDLQAASRAYPLPGLHLLGLSVMALVLCGLDLRPEVLLWWCAASGGTYALAVAAAWAARGRWASRVAGALRLPGRPGESPEVEMLRGLQLLVAAGVAVAALRVVFTFSPEVLEVSPAGAFLLRAGAAAVALLQVLSLALVVAPGRLSAFHGAALWLAALGLLLCLWAFIEPASARDRLVDRAAPAVLAAAVSFWAAAWAGARAPSVVWREAARRWAPPGAVLVAVSVLAVFAAEVAEILFAGEVPLSAAGVAAVFAGCVGTAGACLVFALLPESDPLARPARGRTGYVYAAEVLVALSVLHLRLARPEWFGGFFERYWPLFLVALAFLGVGASELLRRRGVAVVSGPLAATGVFLPLVPVVGFWVIGSRVHYSAVLFVVGLFYGVLAVARRSFGFGLVAALAANGGLWYVLHESEGYGFLEHPQLWLIPGALSVLVAAHLNRAALTEAQLVAVRYLALMVTYVSSTADLFLGGVARSPGLLLVLGGLSVGGVLLGILWRVQSFLFLGGAFLFLTLLGGIWQAAANLGWTWIWYVAGIAAGVAILVVFALFERKRAAVLGLLEGLRRWER